MALYYEIHPVNPQERLIKQAVGLIQQGQILAVPTDSSYALVCQLDDKSAADHLRRIRGIDEKHLLTILCKDLSELSSYAKVDNRQFRLLKQATPGPYTFVLQASREVPKRVSHPQRKTIGLRVPEHVVLLALLDAYNAPLLASTLVLPEEDEPLNDPQEILERLGHELGAVIDAGSLANKQTTLLDLTEMSRGGELIVLRHGQGSLEKIGLSE